MKLSERLEVLDINTKLNQLRMSIALCYNHMSRELGILLGDIPEDIRKVQKQAAAMVDQIFTSEALTHNKVVYPDVEIEDMRATLVVARHAHDYGQQLCKKAEAMARALRNGS